MTKRSKVVGFAGAAKPKPPNAGKGRKKGVPNKTTVAVKTALLEAFEELGGVPALVKWGQKSPTEFYKLWGRLLPLEVSGPGGAPIPIAMELTSALAKLSPEERANLREVAMKLEGS